MPLTQIQSGMMDSVAQYYGFKNRIINGAMMIDQRNNGASVTPAVGGTGTYTLDRWNAYGTQATKYTVQQNAGSVTPPAGFANYLGVTSSSAYAIVASDIFLLRQFVEGFNVSDFGWGTANAQTVTLSFWIRSSLTGTFGGIIQNSAFNRHYPFVFTISVANTWEQKTITIPGDTSGTWLTNNQAGVIINFGLGVGSTFSGTAGAWTGGNIFGVTGATSVVGTNGATFYITGVQLEKGSTATSFDYRPYGTELQLCQRYCHAYSSYTLGRAQSADTVYGGGVTLSPTMRATPTLRSGATFAVSGGSAGTPQILSSTGYTSSPDNVYISNASANWTVNAVSALTGIFEAEL